MNPTITTPSPNLAAYPLNTAELHPRQTQPPQEQTIVERCLERRWGVPTASRNSMISQLIAIVECTGTKDRDRVRAFRALLEAEKLDLDSVKTAATVAAMQKFAEGVGETGKLAVGDVDLVEGAAILLGRKEEQSNSVLPTLMEDDISEYEVA